MVRIRGGKAIPPEGLRLYVVHDSDGTFLSKGGEPLVEQYIPLGSPIEVDGRRGKYCELTLDSGTKQCEAVIRFDNRELMPIDAITPDMKVVVFQNGKE